MPLLKRDVSVEDSDDINSYSDETFYNEVSKKAEEIIKRYEMMWMDSSETVHTQTPSPVEQPEELVLMQDMPQCQFSEFPLDQVYLLSVLL